MIIELRNLFPGPVVELEMSEFPRNNSAPDNQEKLLSIRTKNHEPQEKKPDCRRQNSPV
jgi:hypothetical protein